MYGYTRCPKCKKILFEEDLEGGDNEKLKCPYCGKDIDEKKMEWRHRMP